MERAYQKLEYTFARRKFVLIVNHIQRRLEVTALEIAYFLNGGGEGYTDVYPTMQAWYDKHSAKEIADWALEKLS